MDEAIRKYLEYLQNIKHRSENTILAYKRDLKQFATFVRQVDHSSGPERVSIPGIEHYLERLMAQNYKSSTIARKCAAVRGFIEFWHSDEILPLNCIDQRMNDIEPARYPPKVLSNDQIFELLTAPTEIDNPLGLRDTAILFLLYETGLRVSDIIHLQLEDLDLAEKYIRIKSFRRRNIPISESTKHLEKYLTEGRPHLARIPEERSVFLNQRGRGLTRQGVWFIVRKWADAAQMDQTISPNTIRHSLIRHLMDSGLNKKEILRRVGLKSPNSLRYFNVSQKTGGDP
jgi:integrase/recombinase XerD